MSASPLILGLRGSPAADDKKDSEYKDLSSFLIYYSRSHLEIMETVTKRPEPARAGSDSGDTIVEDTRTKKSRKPFSFWMIILALACACFLSALDLTAVTTALPTISHDLKSENFSWVGSSYALSSTAFLPVFGGLAQTFGRKPPLMACIVIFAIGSAVCGSAHNIGALLSGRTIQGIGVRIYSRPPLFCIADVYAGRWHSRLVRGRCEFAPDV